VTWEAREMKRFAKLISENDNVVTVLTDVKAGENVTVRRGGKESLYVCNQDIPLGHKLAIVKMKKGDSVIKYGEKIGIATKEIEIGDWVHTHNVLDDYVCRDKNGKPLPGQVA
jgi:altronate dehydratase small subunit